MCAMVASSVPLAAASAEAANAALDSVEELIAALDAGRALGDLQDQVDALVSVVGDIAAAAAVGVSSAAST